MSRTGNIGKPIRAAGCLTIPHIQNDGVGSVKVGIRHRGRLVPGPQCVWEAISPEGEASIGGKLSQAKQTGTCWNGGGQLQILILQHEFPCQLMLYWMKSRLLSPRLRGEGVPCSTGTMLGAAARLKNDAIACSVEERCRARSHAGDSKAEGRCAVLQSIGWIPLHPACAGRPELCCRLSV